MSYQDVFYLLQERYDARKCLARVSEILKGLPQTSPVITSAKRAGVIAQENEVTIKELERIRGLPDREIYGALDKHPQSARLMSRLSLDSTLVDTMNLMHQALADENVQRAIDKEEANERYENVQRAYQAQSRKTTDMFATIVTGLEDVRDRIERLEDNEKYNPVIRIKPPTPRRYNTRSTKRARGSLSAWATSHREEDDVDG